jgi:hypothetical protein
MFRSSGRPVYEKPVQRKCTGPVAPSSGFPTDHRRSDCHSESHQPRTLRTRCKPHTRRRTRARQGPKSEDVANCDVFFSHRVQLQAKLLALVQTDRKRRPGARPGRKYSPSRERFRPPSRQTVRFRVVLLGGLRPTGAPCSAQAGLYVARWRRSRVRPNEFRAICVRLRDRSSRVRPDAERRHPTRLPDAVETVGCRDGRLAQGLGCPRMPGRRSLPELRAHLAGALRQGRDGLGAHALLRTVWTRA